jgi:hypothetical protein
MTTGRKAKHWLKCCFGRKADFSTALAHDEPVSSFGRNDGFAGLFNLGPPLQHLLHDVDGGGCGAYAPVQLTGPGFSRDITCRLVRLLLLLLKAHTRKTSLLPRPVSNSFRGDSLWLLNK